MFGISHSTQFTFYFEQLKLSEKDTFIFCFQNRIFSKKQVDNGFSEKLIKVSFRNDTTGAQTYRNFDKCILRYFQ